MRYFSTQGSVRLFVACNLKRAILLELFDYCISHEDFDARHERAILKRGHCNTVNVPQIVRLYRSNVISKTTGDREAKDCRK